MDFEWYNPHRIVSDANFYFHRQHRILVYSLATENGWMLIIVAVVVGVLLGSTQMNDDPKMAIVGVIRVLPGFGMSVVGNPILTVTIFIVDLPVFYHLTSIF